MDSWIGRTLTRPARAGGLRGLYGEMTLWLRKGPIHGGLLLHNIADSWLVSGDVFQRKPVFTIPLDTS